MDIYHILIDTPLGGMIAYSTNRGICLLEFKNRKNINKQIQSIEKLTDTNFIDKSNTHLKLLREELKEYFAGERKIFSVSLDLIGTDFQKRVWRELLNIPFGKTITYIQQAIAIGNPKSVRAVANANGMNKISIIVPCHRVIGTNGTLTGYAGGLERKQELLDLESPEKKLLFK